MSAPIHDDPAQELHEINVTPFIDVMLVLLIIFMVAAPLATVDVPVNLPATTGSRQLRPDKPLFLTVRSSLTLLVGELPVSRQAVGPSLLAAAGGDKKRLIFVRADRAVSYGDLMEVLNLLRAAGFLKIALVGLEKTSP